MKHPEHPDDKRQPSLAHDHDAAVAFLNGRIDFERALSLPYGSRDLKLDRMRGLLDRLGNPERNFPIIHVGGTKGKGSTVAMIGAMLTAAGHRVGQFTSPHVDRVEQRIAVDAQPCSAEELVALVDWVRPAVDAMDRQPAPADNPLENQPTYFEITTAMALGHFARHKVDVALVEVGLGGRLDSTNVCRPILTIITNISFDHTRQLGTTLRSIAQEKAGIVKPGVPLLSGVVDDEARAVIRQVCAEQRAPLAELGVDFHFDYHPGDSPDARAAATVDFRHTHGDAFRALRLGMLGRHQAANAAVALAAIVHLRRSGWTVPEAAIASGLAAAVCPARIEILPREPLVVIDAAHNLASIEALADVVRHHFAGRRTWLIFAATQEKDLRGMLDVAFEVFDEVILTRYTNNPRAVAPDQLAALAEASGRPRPPTAATPSEAWSDVIRQASSADVICIAGSFYLAAEMRQLLAEQHDE